MKTRSLLSKLAAANVLPSTLTREELEHLAAIKDKTLIELLIRAHTVPAEALLLFETDDLVNLDALSAEQKKVYQKLINII